VAQRLKVLPDLASKFKDAEDGEEDGREDVDEDLVRERALLEIEEALLQALNELPMLREERQMLQMRAQMGGVCVCVCARARS